MDRSRRGFISRADVNRFLFEYDCDNSVRTNLHSLFDVHRRERINFSEYCQLLGIRAQASDTPDQQETNNSVLGVKQSSNIASDDNSTMAHFRTRPNSGQIGNPSLQTSSAVIFAPKETKYIGLDGMSGIPSVQTRIASLMQSSDLSVARTRHSVRTEKHSYQRALGLPESSVIPMHPGCRNFDSHCYHCANCNCQLETSFSPILKPTHQLQVMGKRSSSSLIMGDRNVDSSKNRRTHSVEKGWLFHQTTPKFGVKGRDKRRHRGASDRSRMFMDPMEGMEFVNLLTVEEEEEGGGSGKFSEFYNLDLELVVRLAGHALSQAPSDTKVAAHLKRALDLRLGRVWHVVTGQGPYGSHVASLPGALAHFRLCGWAFLVWQTPED